MEKIIVILNERNFRNNWDVVWFNEFIEMLYSTFNLIYISPNSYNDDDFLIKYNKIPDYIIGYEIFNFPKNKSIKILITEDLHLRPLNTYDNLFSEINYILPRFNIINNLFNYKFNKKIIKFPLYCSNVFLTNVINYNSDNKIIMYGNIQHEQYHLRKKWKNYMDINYNDLFLYIHANSLNTSMIMKKNSFGIACGYVPKSFENIGQNKNGYVVGKFFEILGNGLLLLADTSSLKEEIEEYGFKNMVNYIDINFNNIDEIIKFIYDINNIHIINKIRKNGHELIKNNHLLNNRINTLKNLMLYKNI